MQDKIPLAIRSETAEDWAAFQVIVGRHPSQKDATGDLGP